VGARYEEKFDSSFEAEMRVEFTTVGREVTSYSVVLVFTVDEGRRETARLYDSAHGFTEMHRYGRGSGKSSGKRFHNGTLGEGMRTAIEEIKRRHEAMIEGWKGDL
jgi:hypothetical protein